MVNRPQLLADLKRDEGVRVKPYIDTAGVLSIGVGRNLTEVGLRPLEIDYLLSNDVYEAIEDCESFDWWELLNEVRQRALVNMRFNLGPSRFRGFVLMLDAIGQQDYYTAAQQMLLSTWSTQVGARAIRLARMIEHGTDPA